MSGQEYQADKDEIKSYSLTQRDFLIYEKLTNRPFRQGGYETTPRPNASAMIQARVAVVNLKTMYMLD